MTEWIKCGLPAPGLRVFCRKPFGHDGPHEGIDYENVWQGHGFTLPTSDQKPRSVMREWDNDD